MTDLAKYSDIQVTYEAMQEILEAGRAWGAQEVEAWRDSHDDGTLMPDWTRGTYCSDLPGTPGETLHDMFQALIDLEAERVWNEARRIYDVDRDGN